MNNTTLNDAATNRGRLSRLEVKDPDGAPIAGSETSGLSAGAEAVVSVAQAMVTNPKVSGPGLSRSDLDQLFADDHVHAALVIEDGRLVTVIQRTDLEDSLPDADPCSLGTLTGRVVAPGAPLAAVHAHMRQEQRRRLAVIDESGRLLGLLCLKKSGTGFCSDADVRSRELERDRQRSASTVWTPQIANDDAGVAGQDAADASSRWR
jgi:hypothetical protein